MPRRRMPGSKDGRNSGDYVCNSKHPDVPACGDGRNVIADLISQSADRKRHRDGVAKHHDRRPRPAVLAFDSLGECRLSANRRNDDRRAARQSKCSGVEQHVVVRPDDERSSRIGGARIMAENIADRLDPPLKFRRSHPFARLRRHSFMRRRELPTRQRIGRLRKIAPVARMARIFRPIHCFAPQHRSRHTSGFATCDR